MRKLFVEPCGERDVAEAIAAFHESNHQLAEVVSPGDRATSSMKSA